MYFHSVLRVKGEVHQVDRYERFTASGEVERDVRPPVPTQARLLGIRFSFPLFFSLVFTVYGAHGLLNPSNDSKGRGGTPFVDHTDQV